MKKVIAVVIGFCVLVCFFAVLVVFLTSSSSSVQLEIPFESSDIESVEMFHFVNPTEAEKKVLTEQTDIQSLTDTLERISLKERETEPVAGGSVTSFRFHGSGGTVYEVIYSSIAVKAGWIKFTGSEKDYFTVADLEACWNNYDSEIMSADEKELPALY